MIIKILHYDRKGRLHGSAGVHQAAVEDSREESDR